MLLGNRASNWTPKSTSSTPERLAVPLLILISTIAAHLPSLRWLDVLLSDDRPVSERIVRPPLASVKPRTLKPARTVQRRRVAAK